MLKKLKIIVLFLCITAIGLASVPAHAYTEAEKQAVKDWLSSHGYPPTMAGAEQAYQDYLNGMWQEEARKYLGEDVDDLDEEEDSDSQMKKMNLRIQTGKRMSLPQLLKRKNSQNQKSRYLTENRLPEQNQKR